jgi:hypothetical protein
MCWKCRAGAEGIAWIDGLHGNWEAANNLRHHLWWHAAMFLERGEMDRILALYDGEFRNLMSRLTEAQPDLYIDVQNAASMLFRLQRHGVDVGDRWVELADRPEARSGDCLSAFTLPHWMMALAATGRYAAAHRMLEAMRAFARGPGITATLVARSALPICEAVLAHARGEYADAVEAMRPALGGMYRLGGSHTQQDVLEQLYLDAAMQAGPPQRRLGYAAAARTVGCETEVNAMNALTGALLIGSVPLPDAETVFRSIARELGPHLALLAALRDIADAIPHRDLSIQWDVCQEVLVFEHYFPHRPPSYKADIATELARLGDAVPDDGYFAPLADLSLPAETALYLGLIHHADAEGNRARIAAARKVVLRFGVATECGWGRTDPGRVSGLLAAHRSAIEDATY